MGNIVKSKKVSQNSQREAQMGNAPMGFAPNEPIGFDQQVAATAALERASNASGHPPVENPVTHYKKPQFPTSKPVAK